MLQTICYDRLQSRESCSCDKNISLLQMQDIHLFSVLPFLFHYQQIHHVLYSDSWYFAPSTYKKELLLSSNQPDVDFFCLYNFLSVFLQFTIFTHGLLLCSNSWSYLSYIAFIYLVTFTSWLSKCGLLARMWNITWCVNKSNSEKAALLIAKVRMLPSNLSQKEMLIGAAAKTVKLKYYKIEWV